MKYLAFVSLFLVCSSAMNLPEEEQYIDLSVDMPTLEGRITNGETASIAQFPYQVGLELRSTLGTAWCGGSLIHENWVLTAAHCVQGIKSATVLLGATLRTQPEQKIKVSKSGLIAHSKYKSKTIQNDIALIKLPTPAKLSANIQTISLPAETSVDYSGDEAVIAGWGRTSDRSNSLPTRLQYATLSLAPSKTCSRLYGFRSFTRKNICAKTPDYTSTCQGDSGGPLVLADFGEQIGIVSYGSSEGCAKGYPVVFTRVSSFISWINEVTGLDF